MEAFNLINILKLSQVFADLMVPSVCPVCGYAAAKPGVFLCAKCYTGLHRNISLMETRSGSIPVILSCSSYSGPVRECIRCVKYHGNKLLIRTMARIINRAIPLNRLFRDADVIIPVPLSAWRYRQRGFNQAETLGRFISGITGIPMSTDILFKIRRTTPQSGLNKKERVNNLKGSFYVSAGNIKKYRSAVLVDDVITTGATLDCCAAGLRDNGIDDIKGFTLAKTL